MSSLVLLQVNVNLWILFSLCQCLLKYCMIVCTGVPICVCLACVHMRLPVSYWPLSVSCAGVRCLCTSGLTVPLNGGSTQTNQNSFLPLSPLSAHASACHWSPSVGHAPETVKCKNNLWNILHITICLVTWKVNLDTTNQDNIIHWCMHEGAS